MTKTKKGFTLIELLVVIAIIGILATIIIINVSVARGKAVNAHVLADLNTADKTATTCMTLGYYMNKSTTVGTVTGKPWDGTSPVINLRSTTSGGKQNPICAKDVGATVMPDDVSGVWPNIDTYGNSPSGSFWRYSIINHGGSLDNTGTLSLTTAPSFTFYAWDINVTASIACDPTGCRITGM